MGMYQPFGRRKKLPWHDHHDTEANDDSEGEELDDVDLPRTLHCLLLLADIISRAGRTRLSESPNCTLPWVFRIEYNSHLITSLDFSPEAGTHSSTIDSRPPFERLVTSHVFVLNRHCPFTSCHLQDSSVRAIAQSQKFACINLI